MLVKKQGLSDEQKQFIEDNKEKLTQKEITKRLGLPTPFRVNRYLNKGNRIKKNMEGFFQVELSTPEQTWLI